ncbi:urease accessory protein UreF [Phenylobacterium sp. LjRoot225]|uniref:urease accessory protein UreF n=1 Tax=Phenylobacterium sp. LjRoot225 TaxID=3342285 RepID=UPI003ECED396
MSTEAAQLRLLTWFSPAFPVGAFGYSHGLETAIREGRVTGETLEAWIAGLIEHGSGWTDAVLFKLAWSAADEQELADLAELAEALAPSRERHRETMQLGTAFSIAVTPWSRTPPQSASLTAPPRAGEQLGLAPPPCNGGGGSRSETEGASDAPYPVAAGAACSAADIPLASALTAWLHGFAANLVSVAVRAIPIGQSEAVRVLAALEPALLDAAERAAIADRDDLGGCAFLSDIAAMRHETLQPRLFIS